MERPTDLYLADLMNQAAEALTHLFAMRDPTLGPNSPHDLVNRLQSSSRAVRGNIPTSATLDGLHSMDPAERRRRFPSVTLKGDPDRPDMAARPNDTDIYEDTP